MREYTGQPQGQEGVNRYRKRILLVCFQARSLIGAWWNHNVPCQEEC